jgi:hypothetical protein
VLTWVQGERELQSVLVDLRHRPHGDGGANPHGRSRCASSEAAAKAAAASIATRGGSTVMAAPIACTSSALLPPPPPPPQYVYLPIIARLESDFFPLREVMLLK